eukprot:scaffold9_cov111-Cylindrotheca_fusiformis.AAC.3
MCASTVGSLSSGGSIGWTLATTVGVGTAFLANTASVNRNFEEARNELHGIAERMEERMENGFAEVKNELHAIEEKMEKMEGKMDKGFTELKLSNTQTQLSMKQTTLFFIQKELRSEKKTLKSATPAEKIEITNDINDLEEQKANLEREIGQLEALESGQEWQGSGSANFIPGSPTS